MSSGIRRNLSQQLTLSRQFTRYDYSFDLSLSSSFHFRSLLADYPPTEKTHRVSRVSYGGSASLTLHAEHTINLRAESVSLFRKHEMRTRESYDSRPTSP